MPAPTSFLSEIIGLFGQPVDENPTQYMQEEAFRSLGLKFRYVNFEVPPGNLEAAAAGMRALNFAGANCTIPHKVAIIPYLDQLTETGAKIGAINTIVRQKDGTYLGENTDGKGFITAVTEAGLTIPGVNAIVFGAGGAARAIAVELAVAGASKITLVNRTAEKAERLAEHVTNVTGVPTTAEAWMGEHAVPADTQVVVNSTSIALKPNINDVVPIDYSTLKSSMLVCDVIPNPPDTPFLKAARAAGATTLDGLGMLVYQGAIAFKMWTGYDAPTDVMRRALEEVFEQD